MIAADLPALTPPAACWQVGADAPERILRGVLTREATAPQRWRWTLNLPQAVAVCGLTGRIRQVTLRPASAEATRRLQAIVRLRVTLRGRPVIEGGELVLPIG
ncbi:hypothetical protein IP88_01420 [alpha proteobacterium AAP81b]|nr:hypothetical protein IP88_01420 [alpha proteobacterium AAP81b]